MPKRAPLDLNQFKIDLPKPQRDPLETIIPTTPPLVTNSTNRPLDQSATRPSDQMAERSTDQADRRPKGRMTVRPKGQQTKRVIKRNGFDVYQDQIMSLNKIQFELYSHRGKKPSIGELIRPALDKLIAEKLKEVGEL